MSHRAVVLPVLLLVAALAGVPPAVLAAAPVLDGAELGKWTMDWDAAKALAAEKDAAILLNFTGSDWCGWCKLMDKNVFADEAWQPYADRKLVLVTLDFPQDKKLVPERYVARNEALREQFGVQGFPTYVLLDADGATELGRLGAGREKTARSFIAEVEEALRFRGPEIAAFAAKLPDAGAAEAYRKSAAELLSARRRRQQLDQEYKRETEALDARVTALTAELAAVHLEAKVRELGPEKGERYRALTADLAKARADLDEWLESKPQRTDENTAKFQGFQERIAELTKELNAF